MRTQRLQRSATGPLFKIAVLTAAAGQRDALAAALQALLEPTRQEAGCLDYVLFEAQDRPGTFFMRESFISQAAFDAHCETDYFLDFKGRCPQLLGEPLKLLPLLKLG